MTLFEEVTITCLILLVCSVLVLGRKIEELRKTLQILDKKLINDKQSQEETEAAVELDLNNRLDQLQRMRFSPSFVRQKYTRS